MGGVVCSERRIRFKVKICLGDIQRRRVTKENYGSQPTTPRWSSVHLDTTLIVANGRGETRRMHTAREMKPKEDEARGRHGDQVGNDALLD